MNKVLMAQPQFSNFDMESGEESFTLKIIKRLIMLVTVFTNMLEMQQHGE